MSTMLLSAQLVPAPACRPGRHRARPVAASCAPASPDAAQLVEDALGAALLRAVLESRGEVSQAVAWVPREGCSARGAPWPKGTRLFELAPPGPLGGAPAEPSGTVPKGVLLRRVAADARSGPCGWSERLVASGFLPDRPSAWAVCEFHTLSTAAQETLVEEAGTVAALRSELLASAHVSDERRLRTLLAAAGFQLLAWESLEAVAASSGVPSAPGCEALALFAASKTRLTGRQEDDLREQLQRAELESGEEGFADA